MEQDGRLRVCVGGSGGPRIISAVLQTVLRWVPASRRTVQSVHACMRAWLRAGWACVRALKSRPSFVAPAGCFTQGRPSPAHVQTHSVWRTCVRCSGQSTPASSARPIHPLRRELECGGHQFQLQQTPAGGTLPMGWLNCALGMITPPRMRLAPDRLGQVVAWSVARCTTADDLAKRHSHRCPSAQRWKLHVRHQPLIHACLKTGTCPARPRHPVHQLGRRGAGCGGGL